MSTHLRPFRSLFSSYATERSQRRKLKLLQLPDLSSCTADCHSSSHHGPDDNGIRNKERQRRWRKRKQTAKEEGECVPLEEELSIKMVKLYQSGDPLGKKELGRHVVQWLKQGMHLMASKFASSEIQDDGTTLSLAGGSADVHMRFVMQAQPYLSATPMPKGQESLCLKASTHYPTLFDNFQRELRDVLLQQQNEGLITDWCSTQSWMLLKELAKSAEHQEAARRSRNPVMHGTLGVSLDKTRLMQTKIDDFVKKMTDLLHLERDAELEFTQAELNATSMMDAKSEKPVQPVEYLRNCEALMLLQKRGLQKRNASIGLVAILFGDKEDVLKLEQNGMIDWGGPEVHDEALLERHNYNFDASQSKALALALNKKGPVLVIQGPPGTGKTGLLSYLITCVVHRGERVLVTAPSNAAIDNIVEKLSSTGLRGRLEKFTREFERKKFDLRNDLKHRIQDDSLASGIRQLLKKLGKEYKKKEKETIKEVLSNAEVVLSTNIGAADPLIRGSGSFDLVIIDEAGQAIEPSCWIPILQGKRCILAGDHRQLAPVVLSREAVECGLGISLLERASSLHDQLLTTTLIMQYRMHDSIASWESNEMYDGLLKSSPSVASRLLVDYPFIKATWMTQCALMLLDTRMPYGSLNIDCEERLDPAGTGSFYNSGKADIVSQHVLSLVRCGLPPTSIAVQSPYIGQVQMLRSRLEEYPLASGVEVSTIDSFQGREADAVVISMVRSNSLGAVGFLGDSRRMNVAITRARSHVAVVCDSSTIRNNAFLARLLHHIRKHGQVRYVEPGSLDGDFGLGFNPPALLNEKCPRI
ncbi:unnamed protein product [Urochloa decumbens]|uniref:Helicase ATP-binding domain-containing protein n=1 Tax=Urochloa decumbens TaxID=240449 RepID=A0ABC9FHD7_9POAL